MRLLAPLALAVAVAGGGVCAWRGASADEDAAAAVYAKRFTFGRDGVPTISVGVLDRVRGATVVGEAGVRVVTSSDDGTEVRGGRRWSLTVAGARPAVVRWWTVVSRRATDDEAARWRARGYAPRTFETGFLLAIRGRMLDEREQLLAIAPADDERAAATTARAVAARWGVATSVHPELVRPPGGWIVARDEERGVEVRSAGALWLESDGGALELAAAGGGRERRYRGRLVAAVAVDGTLSVANLVAEDHLLAGIVPAETFPGAPPAALAAQAIAARTELYAKIGDRHHLDPYLVCGTHHCQVYGGAGHEDPRTTAAVAATRGQVLLRDGRLVAAAYSASCGGHGERNEHVWGGTPDPSLRGRPDATGAGARVLGRFAGTLATDAAVRAFLATPAEAASCGRTRYARGRYRWSVELPADELDRRVAALHPGVGAVRALVPGDRGASGRARSLRLVGTRATAVVEGDMAIRRLLGLKSALFVVTPVRRAGRLAAWRLDGGGFGHGVGMCQTGAIGMAEAGHPVASVLRHYYPGSAIVSLY